MTPQEIIQANREDKDLYFAGEGGNVYYVVGGWYDHFLVTADDTDESEVYCYAPTHTVSNSPVDTLFVELVVLAKMHVVPEGEARKLHPALFEHLKKINEEG